MTLDKTTAIFSFDPAEYPFHDILERYIGAGRLTGLRAELPREGVGEGASLYRNMEASPHFHAMYAGLQGGAGREFYEVYHRFLRDVIAPQYAGPIYFQRRPSHRILFADTPGASRFHRDSDYGHAAVEVNYLVPQTPAYATNTIWIETAVGSGEFEAIELKLGEYVRFDGAARLHGAKRNATGHSRVSFDFRVVPAGSADEEIRESAQRGAGEAANPVRDNARVFDLLNGARPGASAR